MPGHALVANATANRRVRALARPCHALLQFRYLSVLPLRRSSLLSVYRCALQATRDASLPAS